MFERALVRANRWLIVAMMAVMVALVFANVVGRYGFNRSIIWAEELSQYLMVWIAYLGAGLALREGRHVSVDILQDLLPEPLRRGLRMLVAAALLAFFATLVWLGLRYVELGWDQETPVMQIRTGIAYLAIPIGAALFVLHFLFFWRRFVDKRFDEVENLEPDDEAGGAPAPAAGGSAR